MGIELNVSERIPKENLLKSLPMKQYDYSTGFGDASGLWSTGKSVTASLVDLSLASSVDCGVGCGSDCPGDDSGKRASPSSTISESASTKACKFLNTYR
ncbi:hypothetical protein [Spongorhabdus nitratireducens]